MEVLCQDHVVKFTFDISTLKIENVKSTCFGLFPSRFQWLNCVNNLFGQLDFGTILGSYKTVLGYLPSQNLQYTLQYICDPSSFYLDIVAQPVLSVRQSCKMTNNATPPSIYHVPCHGLTTCFNAFLANPLQSMQDCISGSSMCLDSAAI